MNYTKEQLYNLPFPVLRGLDIKTQEEEKLVQEVVNNRMADMPIAVDLSINSSLTDNMSPEKEAILQAEIDEKRNVIKNKLLPEVNYVDSMSPEERVEQEKIQESVIVTTSESTEPVVVEKIKAPFCQFCDSRGVRHKKNCTRDKVV